MLAFELSNSKWWWWMYYCNYQFRWTCSSGWSACIKDCWLPSSRATFVKRTDCHSNV